MRADILFRGICKKKEEFVYGGYAQQGHKSYIINNGAMVGDKREFDIIEVIPETVGQYIGFRDTATIEIFEHDLMAVYYPSGTVRFGVQRKDGERFVICEKDKWIIEDINTPGVRVEVLGNIWENKELYEGLKGDQ